MSFSVVAPEDRGSASMILCCLCGTSIYPNAANQCGACLAQQYDLHDIVTRGPSNGDLVLHQCRQCRRYERTATNHVRLGPESPELLAMLLKKIPALQPHSSNGNTTGSGGAGVSKMTLVDAGWVWTEPHSMRLKLRLTVRADLLDNGAVTVQQRVMATFVVKFRQCPDCNREFTNRTWQALVQIRQRRDDGGAGSASRGLMVLEMALARNEDVRKHVLRIVTTKNGFDFYFLNVSHAQKFASYIARVAPVRTKTSKKLVSEDLKNNTANVKWTLSVDMVPLCRDDLVLCCKGTMMGVNKLEGRMALVTKVTKCVHLVDASPARSNTVEDALADLHPDKYWKGGEKNTVRLLLSSKRLVRFVVLDVEPCRTHKNNVTRSPVRYQGPNSGVDKYALADVEVVRECDFGRNDESFHCVTHLGHLLQYGDIVLGYDLTTSILPNDLAESSSCDPGGGTGRPTRFTSPAFNHNFVMPDVVLVKKIQGVASTGNDDNDDDSLLLSSSTANTNNNNESSNTTGGKRAKVKASASKKRERRRKKQELKEQELEETATRMGILELTTTNNNSKKGDNNDKNAVIQAALEKALENDPDWKTDLDLVERELAMASSSTVHNKQQVEEEKDAELQDGVEDDTLENNNHEPELDKQR